MSTLQIRRPWEYCQLTYSHDKFHIWWFFNWEPIHTIYINVVSGVNFAQISLRLILFIYSNTSAWCLYYILYPNKFLNKNNSRCNFIYCICCISKTEKGFIFQRKVQRKCLHMSWTILIDLVLLFNLEFLHLVFYIPHYCKLT